MKLLVDDLRRRGWYWIGDQIIDQYGRLIGPNGITVYNVLARHAGKYGTTTVGRQLIAAKSGLSLSTVKRALRTLEDYRLIQTEPRYNESGRQTSNRYQLLSPPIMKGKAEEQEQDGPEDRANSPSPHIPSLKDSTLGVTGEPPEGVTGEPLPGSPVTGGSQVNPSLEPKIREAIISQFEGGSIGIILQNAEFEHTDHEIIIRCETPAMLELNKLEKYNRLARAITKAVGERVAIRVISKPQGET